MKIKLFFKIALSGSGGGLHFLRHFNSYMAKNHSDIFQQGRCLFPSLILTNGGTRGAGISLTEDELHNIKKFGSPSLLYYLKDYADYDKNSLLYKFFRKLHSIRSLNNLLKINTKWNIPYLIHRVDGYRKVYHSHEDILRLKESSPPLTDQLDITQQTGINLSDHVIFQSKFSHECSKIFGYNGDNYDIIHNGTDQSIFFPNNRTSINPNGKIKILAASWSSHINKGFKYISRISQMKNVSVTFVGRWNYTVPVNKVKIVGLSSVDTMASLYRSHNIFLQPASNESCPNTAVEAMSSGLPVLYLDSGGTGEICSEFGLPFSEDNLEDKLEELVHSYSILRHKLLNSLDRFDISTVCKKYVSVFDKVIKKKSRGS